MQFLAKLSLTAAVLGTVLASPVVLAQAFKPSKTVEIVVHTGPGGGNDAFARAFLQAMKKDNLLQANFVVLNKTGGGSVNLVNYLRDKTGDSHTLGVYASVFITDGLVQEAASLTIDKLTPVAGMVIEPALLVVRADSPFKTLTDFVNAAKASPGKLKQSGGSVLARDAVMRQVLMHYSKADWSFISFPSGGERVSALLGGHVDIMMIEPSEAGELIRAGKLRALAQIAEQRIPGFPDAPTLKEAGFNVPSVPQPRGLIGPPNMPPEAVAYYTDLIKRASESPAYKEYLQATHLENRYLPPAELTKFLKSYQDQMRETLKGAGVKVVR